MKESFEASTMDLFIAYSANAALVLATFAQKKGALSAFNHIDFGDSSAHA